MASKKSFKTNCPKCVKHNFYVTESNGLSYCFNCGYWERDGDHAYEPKVRSEYIDEIRKLYKQAAEYYHSCLTTKARQFLFNRGYTQETIEKNKIGWCPAGKHPMYKGLIASEAGIGMPHNESAFLADRIIFPYYKDNTTIIDIRGRSIDPEEPLKYKSPFHGAFYRGADWPYNARLSKSDTVLVSEGEIKADSAMQLGYAALAMPGMNSIRSFIQHDNQRVIIIFDSQQKNQYFVNQAISKLAQKLINPYVATLPLMGKDKMDCDSFILEYGEYMFRNVIEGALTFNEWKQLQRF